MFRLVLFALVAAGVTAGCGDDSGGAGDAGVDAGSPDSATEPDAGPDAGFVFPDGGPPPTGCELVGTDAGVPAPDGGLDPDPAPGAYPALAGPGAPTNTFSESQLLEACAYLDGGEIDRDHHNTVLMLDGYLWMPFAHQAGRGGVAAFDFSDACAPVGVGLGTHEDMRETHAAGVSFMGGRWMVTASLDGIMFWDISDPTAPEMVHDLALEGVDYPDSYDDVVMSTFWQAPYVYVGAADQGVFVVDASDPTAPEVLDASNADHPLAFQPLPDFRVAGVHAIGNLLVVFQTEGAWVNLLDISDPRRPRPVPGGNFAFSAGETDRFGRPEVTYGYFGHVNGDRVMLARSTFGGGLVLYDISDLSAPSFLGNWDAPPIANGGYVFVQNDHAFVGLSNWGARVDISDPTDPTLAQRFEMTGDLDTIVPIGHVGVVSVDDDAIPDQATTVQPFETTPDTRAPVVNMVHPRDGTTDIALSSRFGVTFDEFVDMATVFRGSFRIQRVDDGVPLAGYYSGQEGVVNFWPAEPLEPDTGYELVVPVGGVTDYAGNAVQSEFRATFRTVACE